jgi:hypothetical protein
MPSTAGQLFHCGVGIKGIAIAAATDAWIEAAVGVVAQHLGDDPADDHEHPQILTWIWAVAACH